MEKFLTIDTVTLFGGMVGLTKEQAARRLHQIEPTKKKGVFEITSVVQFKAGEKIMLKDIDKATRARLKCLEPKKKAAKGKGGEEK